MTTTVTWRTSQVMISAQLIRQVLDKFLKAETVKSARIQIRTSDGVYHDVKSLKLLENRIFGARESHRILLEISPVESWKMGAIKKKL